MIILLIYFDLHYFFLKKIFVMVIDCCLLPCLFYLQKKKDEYNKIRMLTILFLHNREHEETCWRGLPKE